MKDISFLPQETSYFSKLEFIVLIKIFIHLTCEIISVKGTIFLIVDKEIFFKPKNNAGSGVDPNKASSAKGGRPASLKGLSSEELLRLAREGKLPTYNF